MFHRAEVKQPVTPGTHALLQVFQVPDDSYSYETMHG
jgi:hypothetical protein